MNGQSIHRLTKIIPAIVFAVALIGAGSMTASAESASQPSPIPEAKQTTLGLYVTAAQAYEKWRAAPDRVTIIDARTAEEYAFIGHPRRSGIFPSPLSPTREITVSPNMARR